MNRVGEQLRRPVYDYPMPPRTRVLLMLRIRQPAIRAVLPVRANVEAQMGASVRPIRVQLINPLLGPLAQAGISPGRPWPTLRVMAPVDTWGPIQERMSVLLEHETVPGLFDRSRVR
jgi:hypothetical protein